MVRLTCNSAHKPPFRGDYLASQANLGRRSPEGRAYHNRTARDFESRQPRKGVIENGTAMSKNAR